MKDMKEVRAQHQIIAVLVIAIFVMVVIDFVKARWEYYDKPTGEYTKGQVEKPSVWFEDIYYRDSTSMGNWSNYYEMAYSDSIKKINDSTSRYYLSRIMSVDEYVPITKRKIRRRE